jgi:hypothetical protein
MIKLLLILILPAAFAANADFPKSSAEFCKNLAKAKDPDGKDFRLKSLARVAVALGGERLTSLQLQLK